MRIGSRSENDVAERAGPDAPVGEHEREAGAVHGEAADRRVRRRGQHPRREGAGAEDHATAHEQHGPGEPADTSHSVPSSSCSTSSSVNASMTAREDLPRDAGVEPLRRREHLDPRQHLVFAGPIDHGHAALPLVADHLADQQTALVEHIDELLVDRIEPPPNIAQIRLTNVSTRHRRLHPLIRSAARSRRPR